MADLKESGSYKSLAKTRFVDDKQITDHYAIIPTGSGLEQLDGMNDTAKRIYELVVRRFLSIFYPAAVYQKVSITTQIGKENFFSNFKILAEEGYLKVAGMAAAKKTTDNDEASDEDENDADNSMFEKIQKLKKGSLLNIKTFNIKEGETTPPKRYNSGSMILAMENAGQLIEDEELRAQIKGSGIGTSATRAEILKKLFGINIGKYAFLTPVALNLLSSSF